MTKTILKNNHHKRHWHYIYHKRRKRLGINALQMSYSQVFSLIGSIIAGVLLDIHKDTLMLVAGVFVILPGVFDLDGSIGAALSAKINHRLEEAKKPAKVLLSSIVFSFKLSASSGLIVSLVGAGIATYFFDANFWQIVIIGWGAIILSGCVGFPIIALMSYYFSSKSINPDDVVGPIESSIFDILTVLTLAIMVTVIAR